MNTTQNGSALRKEQADATANPEINAPGEKGTPEKPAKGPAQQPAQDPVPDSTNSPAGAPAEPSASNDVRQ